MSTTTNQPATGPSTKQTELCTNKQQICPPNVGMTTTGVCEISTRGCGSNHHDSIGELVHHDPLAEKINHDLAPQLHLSMKQQEQLVSYLEDKGACKNTK